MPISIMKVIDKHIGETPLEALERFRVSEKREGDRLSYAGRLDPMASGKLLILEGVENDRREEFLHLDKAYEFTILFGVSTDTFDLLGLADEITDVKLPFTVNEIKAALKSFVGEWNMTYPPYAAKTVSVNGKKVPLWQLARSGNLPDKLPTKDVEVYETTCDGVSKITAESVLDYIHMYIPKVSGDFRQEEIVHRWEEVLGGEQVFAQSSCVVVGSSGLYIRRLAKEVGVQLGVPALAFSITRTQLGTY